MCEDIVFWPRSCSGHLLIDLVTLGPKKFQNKDESFAQYLRHAFCFSYIFLLLESMKRCSTFSFFAFSGSFQHVVSRTSQFYFKQFSLA